MKLTYKIPIITALTVIATIIINIMAFQYFMGPLFREYNETVAKTDQLNTLSPEKLSTILDVSKLSISKQDEYKEVVNELSTISTSLKNISENPELYVSSKGDATGATSAGFALTIESGSTHPTAIPRQTLFAKLGNLIAHPVEFSENSPEGQLVLKLISRLLVTNLLFLTLLMFIYFFWIRQIFAPINIIIDRLRSYIDTAHFHNIRYQKSDEFTPLVSTINNLYQSLKIQENIRSNFLSDVSHEIRTPITAVKCYLEAIEDGVMHLDEKTVPLLQTELSRLTGITEKIMEYDALTQHSADNIYVERFGLMEATETIIHEYSPQLEKNNQTITTQSEEIFIHMDKHMFIQILHNIFSNFIKYAGTGTTLHCEYRKTKKQYRILFTDDGVGIPPDEIGLVKEKFYRIDKSRTQNRDMSMGIGLSIVDHITRIHDGTLDIANISPHGLSLCIILPR